MSQCRIILENHTGYYYAGTEIRGHLECYFDEETTIRGIKLRLICKEYNEWLGEESYYDSQENKHKTRTVSFTGDNEILFLEQLLYNSSHGSEKVPPGRQVYPFSFILPTDLPSSFSGPYGKIDYKLKGTIDRPMRTDYEDEYHFKVISPINFNNRSQHLQQASSYSDEKTLCCGCCARGHINMDVEIERTAFVPGIPVNMRVHITNLSNENVENLRVKLEHYITYRVTHPSSEDKRDVQEILKIIEHGVGANGEHTFDLKLELPPNFEVPNFTRCKLFESKYYLEVSAKMPTCTTDLDINFEPEVGHIQAGTSQPILPGYAEPGFVMPYPPNTIADPTNSITFPSNPSTPYPPNPTPYLPNSSIYPSMGVNSNSGPISEKTLYAPGPPTAPNFGTPQATAPELPPPSYEETQKPPYPTK